MSMFYISTLIFALLGQAPVNDEVAWKPARGPLATQWAGLSGSI